MMYVNKIIMLYNLNLYSVYFNKVERKKDIEQKEEKIKHKPYQTHFLHLQNEGICNTQCLFN